jgi:hypothetical protein
MGAMDGEGSREVGKKARREEIQCVDHNEMS